MAMATAELAVGSFNVLCPLYNRCDEDGTCECDNPSVYTPRLSDVAHEIVRMDADVVCLQVRYPLPSGLCVAWCV
jgi:mRNA deadenylase 3'-5' endonuclease subunit Ccr4